MLFDLLDKWSKKYIKSENLFENLILIFLIALTMGTIVMLLVCETYIWPNGNDLNIGALMHKYLSEGKTSSWGGMLKTACLIAKENWLEWTGCYTSYFFSALQPFIILGRKYVVLNSVILIAGNAFGILYFCRAVLADFLSVDKKKAWICALGILALNMQFVPSAYAAYLWFNGSFYNTIAFSALLIYIVLEMKIAMQDKKNAHRYFLLVLLSIFIGGANYATSMVLIGFNLLFSLNLWAGKNKYAKVKRLGIMTVQILHIICFAITVCAPGNFVRMQEFEQRNAVVAIIYSFVYALRHIFDYMTLPVCCITLILGIYIYINIRKNGYGYRYPGVICLISFCFFAMMEAPTSYAEGCMPPLRQVNIQIWTLYLLAIANTAYFAGWLDNEYISKIPMQQSVKDVLFTAKSKNSALGIGLIILMLICYKPDELTCAIAAKSVFSLKGFAAECEERWELLENDEIKIVSFKPFENFPEIYHGLKDVVVPDSEVNMWINEGFEAYYNKEKVYLDK